MHLKNGKKLYNERGLTFFHETERYVNNLNIYNRSKNGTNLWDDLIHYVRRTVLILCKTTTWGIFESKRPKMHMSLQYEFYNTYLCYTYCML